jgi:hypothetical protein
LDCKQIIGNAIVSSLGGGGGGCIGFYKDTKIIVITINALFTYLYPNSKNRVFGVLSRKNIKKANLKEVMYFTCKDVKETLNLERKISAKVDFCIATSVLGSFLE